jgi:hypothetical protein
MTIQEMGNAPGWAVAFLLIVVALGGFIWKAGPELRRWVEMLRPAKVRPFDMYMSPMSVDSGRGD